MDVMKLKQTATPQRVIFADLKSPKVLKKIMEERRAREKEEWGWGLEGNIKKRMTRGCKNENLVSLQYHAPDQPISTIFTEF